MNETVKGRGAFQGPDEGCPFLEEVEERTSDVRKPGDEGTMISEDSQCRSYLFNGLQYARPFGDARNFARIDAKGLAIKQESQVFYAWLFEGALLGFEEERFLFKEVENIVYNLAVKGRVVWSCDQNVVHIDKYHVGVF